MTFPKSEIPDGGNHDISSHFVIGAMGCVCAVRVYLQTHIHVSESMCVMRAHNQARVNVACKHFGGHALDICEFEQS